MDTDTTPADLIVPLWRFFVADGQPAERSFMLIPRTGSVVRAAGYREVELAEYGELVQETADAMQAARDGG